MKFTYDLDTQLEAILGLVMVVGIGTLVFFLLEGWLAIYARIFVIIIGICISYSLINTFGSSITIDDDGVCYQLRFKSESLDWNDVERIEYDSDQTIHFIGKYQTIEADLKPFLDNEPDFNKAMEYLRKLQSDKIVEAMNFKQNRELRMAKRGLLLFGPLTILGFFYIHNVLVIFAVAMGMLAGVYKVFRILKNPRMRENLGDHFLIGFLGISLATRPWEYFHLDAKWSTYEVQLFLMFAFVFGEDLINAMARDFVEERVKEHGLVISE